MVGYVLEGPRWGTGSSGSSGGTVTWALSDSVPAIFFNDIRAAFSDWSSRANINFQQTTSISIADILFTDKNIDGANGILAQTNYSYSGQYFRSATINFDSSEGWHSSGTQVVSNSSANLFIVALHEIGHGIGLDHYDGDPAVMNTYLNRSVSDLTASDIGGIQALYGKATTSAVASASAFGTVTHDGHSPGGQVYALYDGLLGRAPDPIGLEGWAKALSTGTSLREVAQLFLASPEGQARASALDNAAFVEQLYSATLHRHSDAAGLSYWTGQLNSGVSRGEVGVGFALSNEHFANIQGTLTTGVFVPDADAANSARLYYGILGRAPDASGLATATSAVQTGTSLQSLAQQFLSSPEAQAKFAGADDASFIGRLYENALGRPADAGGLQGWLGAIQHGTSRADIAVQISESPEAQVHLVGQIEQGYQLYA